MSPPLRILFIAADPPWPLDSGVHLRQFHMFDALTAVGEVDLLVVPHDPRPVPPEIASRCRSAVVQPRMPAPASSLRRRAAVLWRELRGYPLTEPPIPADRLTPAAAALLRGEHDLVWIERLTPALMLRHPGGPHTVLDLDDVEHRKLLRSRGARGLHPLRRARTTLTARAWQTHERDALTRFGRVLVCSEVDRDYLADEHVTVAPNGVILPEPPATFSPGVPGRMVFVGLMSYAPNDDAMRYFIRAILPRIRAEVPHAHLHIVGRYVKPDLRRLVDGQTVRLLGYVDDLPGLLREAAVSVVPLRMGGGTRVKILVSLASATPVVSTTVGAEGLDLRDGHELALADSPEAFARACIDLLQDPGRCARLAAAGQRAVHRQYGWKTVQDRVRALAREVAAGGARRSAGGGDGRPGPPPFTAPGGAPRRPMERLEVAQEGPEGPRAGRGLPAAVQED